MPFNVLSLRGNPSTLLLQVAKPEEVEEAEKPNGGGDPHLIGLYDVGCRTCLVDLSQVDSAVL